MNNKIVSIVVIVAILVAALVYFFAGDSKEVNDNNEESTTEETQINTNKETGVKDTQEPGVPTSENPGNQGDVKSQPAYLWQATTTRAGVSNIGVDYVIVFDGEEAVKAQIEDGLCTEASECKSGQYLRNKNAHHRSFEISSTTPIVIEVNGAIKNALEAKGISKTKITFDELKEVLPTLPSFYTRDEEYFKEAKTFVYIDIIGGEVTKIIEP